jgi:hypothetical protein
MESDFLTIENPNTDSGAKHATSIERLSIDGTKSLINHSQGNTKESIIKLSDDRQTMTIKSVVYFMTATPYHVDVMKKASTSVTEIWQLSDDGKTISVQAKAKSNIWDGERSWKTVFDKIN